MCVNGIGTYKGECSCEAALRRGRLVLPAVVSVAVVLETLDLLFARKVEWIRTVRCGCSFFSLQASQSLSRKSEKKAIVKKSSVSYVNENLCYRRLEAINKFDRRRMIVSGGSG